MWDQINVLYTPSFSKDPKLPGDLKEMLEYPLVFDDESISKVRGLRQVYDCLIC